MRSAKQLDKLFSLSIMILGTVVPMLSMLGVGKHLSVAFSALVPIVQGFNMNLQPNAKYKELERVHKLCIAEAHHFLSLTGDYHEAHEHDEHEIKHFLEAIEHHRAAK